MHKETIDGVPNAIPGRTDIELEIYGMEGIPEKDMEERRRVLEQKNQGSLIKILSVLFFNSQFMRVITLVSVFRNSKEKAKPGWLWWIRWGWWTWSLLPAVWFRPAPDGLRPPIYPACHDPWLLCIRDATEQLLRWETATLSAVRKVFV